MWAVGHEQAFFDYFFFTCLCQQSAEVIKLLLNGSNPGVMLLLRKLYDNPGVCTPEKDRWYKYPWLLTLLVNEVQILLVVNQLSRDVIGCDTMTVKSRLVCFNSSLSSRCHLVQKLKCQLLNMGTVKKRINEFCRTEVNRL